MLLTIGGVGDGLLLNHAPGGAASTGGPLFGRLARAGAAVGPGVPGGSPFGGLKRVRHPRRGGPELPR